MTEYDKKHIINMVTNEVHDAKLEYQAALKSNDINLIMTLARKKTSKVYVRNLIMQLFKNITEEELSKM